MIAPKPPNELARLAMLGSLELAGEARQPALQKFTELASELVGASIALMSFVEDERVWFGGAKGYDGCGIPRDLTFCAHALCSEDAVLWIEDAREDDRFRLNPVVAGPPHVRFYAGAAVQANGLPVGVLCVLDTVPRRPCARQQALLSSLAELVSEWLEKRHRIVALRRGIQIAADAVIECDEFGAITAWGDSAHRLFGYSAEEALGQSVRLIIPPEFHDAHEAGMKRWRDTGAARLGRRLELPMVTRDGGRIMAELSMVLWQNHGAARITATILDVTQRKAQAAALVRAKEAAEAANVAKSAFLANMSHEIRTPLNGVVGVADLLAATPLSAYQAELTGIIRASSRQLQNLLGEILDLARIESGRFSLEEAPFNLVEAVSSVADLCRLKAREGGLEFQLDLRIGPERWVIGDATRLKQVLTNLASNAVKFTRSGFVRLTVEDRAGQVCFEISDTGVGFGKEQKAAIFERFQQADGTITRQFGGTGLGLAISRELVALMGGAIDCESEPGRGSRFWFTAPLEAAPTAQAAAEVLSAPRRRYKVLLADDNPTNRRVVELVLHSIEAEITSVENGRQALEAYAVADFDLVLMDMMMPVMDGIEAIGAIRDLERSLGRPRTPIAMLTANNLPEHIEQSLAAGADTHIGKPFSAADLIGAVIALVERPLPEAAHADAEPHLKLRARA